MASNEDILREADYFLENDVTVGQASSDLGISKRTLQLHLQKLESIAPDKFKLVEDKRKANEKRGRIVGGTLGKRKPAWSSEDAIEISNKLVKKGMSYREAESSLGIPKSTIYEMTHSASIDEGTTSLLYALSEANKKGISVEEFLEKHSSEHVASDITHHEIKNEEISGKKSK